VLSAELWVNHRRRCTHCVRLPRFHCADARTHGTEATGGLPELGVFARRTLVLSQLVRRGETCYPNLADPPFRISAILR